MAQNFYDRPKFFAGYSAMRRSVEGLDGAAEWPAVRALLLDLAGKRVVDLGCGFGWFSRRGTSSVFADAAPWRQKTLNWVRGAIVSRVMETGKSHFRVGAC